MTSTKVYHPTDNEITVEVHGRKVTFPFNNETNYVLVPTSIYKSEKDVMTTLKESETVSGVFNHKSINDI